MQDILDIVRVSESARVIRMQDWRVKSALARDALDVPHNYKPWTVQAKKKCAGVHRLPRVAELINIGWIDRERQCRQAAMKAGKAKRPSQEQMAEGFWADISHNAWIGNHGVLCMP